MNKSKLKYVFRNTKGVSKLYGKFVALIKGEGFKIESIPKINPVKTENVKPRLSLVVPTFESDFVYGGISTAIRIFQEIADFLQVEKETDFLSTFIIL